MYATMMREFPSIAVNENRELITAVATFVEYKEPEVEKVMFKLKQLFVESIFVKFTMFYGYTNSM